MIGVTLVGAILFMLFYYYSRFKNKLLVWAFTILLLSALTSTWFGNGGSNGSVLYVYFALLCLLLFLTQGLKRFLLISVLFINISSLLVIEYYHLIPITPYQTPLDRFIHI